MLALITMLGVLGACTKYVPLPPATGPMPVLPADAGDGVGRGREVYRDAEGRRAVRVVIDTHQLRPAVADFCARLEWTHVCNSPEYTDDQGLMGASSEQYGPYAKIAPSKRLGEYDSDSDFASATAKLVGFVWIDQGTLPHTYTSLRLANGFNCVYLRFTSHFTAYVAPQSGGTCPEEHDPSDATALPVRPEPLPPGLTSASDIPPVARFHEGMGDRTVGVPQLGFRCGIQWCIVLPLSAAVRSLPAPYLKENLAERTWSAYGWGDTQTLADTVDNKLVRGTLLGSIIPVQALERMNAEGYPSEFAHAATVRFWSTPSKKYESAWHFRKGDNKVFLRKGSDGDFYGEIRNTKKFLFITIRRYRYEVPIVQYKHLLPIPATARFLWSKDDEDLWIACEFGCCKVVSGTIS